MFWFLWLSSLMKVYSSNRFITNYVSESDLLPTMYEKECTRRYNSSNCYELLKIANFLFPSILILRHFLKNNRGVVFIIFGGTFKNLNLWHEVRCNLIGKPCQFLFLFFSIILLWMVSQVMALNLEFYITCQSPFFCNFIRWHHLCFNTIWLSDRVHHIFHNSKKIKCVWHRLLWSNWDLYPIPLFGLCTSIGCN